ncbi:MAG: anaerobic ribonucleoside-triphosphate reductase activating protein [Sphingobacteriia bacterium]|jgi:anaerobic ribonucleoside-triphosphate reductase activating protein|nr:anaerobic ribonucleoside-triphosphate reductase activating protein [Paludibacteraceae bacterium]NCA79079.1 anaerobic ribonucleoside-triphosphate reductase activating protein [Sphingobacteriia bacterium]
MLKYADYDIVFQEVPNEVTLAINLSNCPNHCKGCHSAYLWGDVGEILTEDALAVLLKKYGQSITCVAFMGGDSEPFEVAKLAHYIHEIYGLKTAWYSGKIRLPDNFPITEFQFIKIGPYCETLGGLKSTATNQRLYKISQNGEKEDITSVFWRKSFDTACDN